MKRPQLALITSVFFLVGVSAPLLRADPSPSTRPATTQATGRVAYPVLRGLILKQDASKAGAYTKDHEVWGVLTEFVAKGQPVTIVALDDGNASIYLGTGGGFIGGFGHESCRRAAKSVCASADPLVPKARRVAELPLPEEGTWQFSHPHAHRDLPGLGHAGGGGK